MTPHDLSTSARRPRRDLLLLLASRSLRAFGFGLSAVTVAVHMESRGLSAVLIGVALAIGLASASLSGVAFAVVAARVGRRKALALCGLLMAIAGLDLAFAPASWLLVPAGLTGMLGLASIDLGPFATVEQAALAESASRSGRNRTFARYSVVGALAGAAGSLAAGLAQRDTGIVFAAYALLGAATATLPLLLSPAAESPARGGRVFGDLRPLAGLAALFALDAFGGGLVANAVIAYWLHIRFGAPLDLLGPVFAGIALVQAASYEVAGRLGDRIGLINTMVFTHLPSNVLLLLVPLSPTLGVAIGLLLARFCLSQMDVPARQAYVVSIVPPAERAGAVASTGALRGVAQALGPLLAGAALQTASLGLPFFVGGGVKIVYDLALYAGFRARRAEHETPGGQGR
jgi:MFS family permease